MLTALATKELQFMSEFAKGKAGISISTLEGDSVSQYLLEAFKIGHKISRYCWSKATALPEALRDVNANDFSFPDSLNTKKKQLPQKHRNRKYPWMNAENWFQLTVRDGKAPRTIYYFYSSSTTRTLTPTILQIRNQSQKGCERMCPRSYDLRRVAMDSGLPSPYFFHHKTRRRGKMETAQTWPSREEGVERLWKQELSSENDMACARLTWWILRAL